MLNIDLGSMFDDQCKISVKLGNQIVEEKVIPLIFARQQFQAMVMQLANDNRPIKIICTMKDTTEKGKVIDNYISFMNNAYINAFGIEE